MDTHALFKTLYAYTCTTVTLIQFLYFHNRGVSHYRILPVSRDIGWPVQQLDYFRYIKQHILTIELLYIGYNFKEIKKRQLIFEESDKTACHFGHLWLHLYTLYFVLAQIASGSQFKECPGAL